MITVRISGPAKEKPRDMASKLGSMLQVSGKIVRMFDAEPPAEVLDQSDGIDVTIITQEAS